MQLRGDYNSTSAVNNAAKTIVTITAPPAAAASASSLHLGVSSARPSSVSTLTIASVPPTLLLEPTLGAAAAIATGSVSAAATPVATTGSRHGSGKHTSFALTPTTMGPTSAMTSSGGHHVSFMPNLGRKSIHRVRSSNSSLSSPTTATAAATASAPSLIETQEEQQLQQQQQQKQQKQAAHPPLEFRQSVQSQITTLEDVDDVDDTDSDSVGMAVVQTIPQLECHVASSSSSSSVK